MGSEALMTLKSQAKVTEMSLQEPSPLLGSKDCSLSTFGIFFHPPLLLMTYQKVVVEGLIPRSAKKREKRKMIGPAKQLKVPGSSSAIFDYEEHLQQC